MQLQMTPRSVQIWFQNRRQRLLKPQANRGDTEGMGDDDDIGIHEAPEDHNEQARPAMFAAMPPSQSHMHGAAALYAHAAVGGERHAPQWPMAHGHTDAHGNNMSTVEYGMYSSVPPSLAASSPQGPHALQAAYASQPLQPTTALAPPNVPAATAALAAAGHANHQAAQHPYPIGQGGHVASGHLSEAAAAGAAFSSYLRGEQAAGLDAETAAGLGATVSLPELVARLGALLMGTGAP